MIQDEHIKKLTVRALFEQARSRLGINWHILDDLLGAAYSQDYHQYTPDQIHKMRILAGPHGKTILKIMEIKNGKRQHTGPATKSVKR